jgi:hypothetical protein
MVNPPFETAGVRGRRRPGLCHTPRVRPLGEQVGRLEKAAADLLAFAPRIEAGTPWPLADVYGAEPEASWGPPELLAHVNEFVPYWMGEIERILDGPSNLPVPFGRIQTDNLRIGVIGRDRTLPPRELFSRIEAEVKRVSARLRELTDAEAGRLGLHPTRGEMRVADTVEPFLAGHLEGHVIQLREILARRPA